MKKNFSDVLYTYECDYHGTFIFHVQFLGISKFKLHSKCMLKLQIRFYFQVFHSSSRISVGKYYTKMMRDSNFSNMNILCTIITEITSKNAGSKHRIFEIINRNQSNKDVLNIDTS